MVLFGYHGVMCYDAEEIQQENMYFSILIVGKFIARK